MTASADLRAPGRPVRVGELLLPTMVTLAGRGPVSAKNFLTLLASPPEPNGLDGDDPASPAASQWASETGHPAASRPTSESGDPVASQPTTGHAPPPAGTRVTADVTPAHRRPPRPAPPTKAVNP